MKVPEEGTTGIGQVRMFALWVALQSGHSTVPAHIIKDASEIEEYIHHGKKKEE